MRWTADLPDETSRTLLGAVDALAQEYLTADRCTGTTRTVEAARVRRAHRPRDGQRHRRDPRRDRAAGVHRPRPGPGLPPRPAGRHPRPPRAAGSRGSTPPSTSSRSTRCSSTSCPATTPEPRSPPGSSNAHHGLRLGEHLETAGNPFLGTGSPPPPRRRPADDASPPERLEPPELPERRERRLRRRQGNLPCNRMVRRRSRRGSGRHVDAARARRRHPRRPDHPLAGQHRRPRPGRRSCASSRRTYRPRKALVERVRARDGHCRFPGCSVPARRCQLDHLVPYPLGDTAEANLHCLCPTHHAFKHHAGWTGRDGRRGHLQLDRADRSHPHDDPRLHPRHDCLRRRVRSDGPPQRSRSAGSDRPG